MRSPTIVPATTPAVATMIAGASSTRRRPSVTTYTGIRAASTINPMAVAVATNAAGDRSYPSSAADRTPPWLPTNPPSNPDAAPAIQPVVRPNRRRSDTPVRPARPTNTSRAAKTTIRKGEVAWRCRTAPVSPPAALITPNVFSTRRLVSRRILQNRTAVATTCGMETAATASRMSTCVLNTGVRMLPMPNPATDAIPPATMDAIATTVVNLKPADMKGRLLPAGPIEQHFRALERDQPVADHLLEVGHERFDLVRRVDDLDHDRQILRELQQLGGVNAAVSTEAHEAFDDRRAGEAALARLDHDRFVERLPVPAVRFADEDPQQLAFGWNSHSFYVVVGPQLFLVAAGTPPPPLLLGAFAPRNGSRLSRPVARSSLVAPTTGDYPLSHRMIANP